MPLTKTSSNEFDGIIVVVDQFSKQTVLMATRKHATTEEIYDLFWERIFPVFGIPKRITSDRDKIFKTEKWQNLMKEIGTTQILSTANHQQTDGQTERKIQELQVYFRTYMDYQQPNWVKLCPLAQYAINDATSTAIGETPNFITFGFERGIEEKDRHPEKMPIIHM